MDKWKAKTRDMEIIIAKYFDYRANLIVPNVFWSMFAHELDLLVLSKSGYAKEIEIKVSKSDLIKDKEKPHNHNDRKIKYLYFAIPDYLLPFIEHIPKRAGILRIDEFGRCKEIRKPIKNNCNYKFSEQEKFEVARLGTMRIWGLKEKILNYRKLRDGSEKEI
jgi:hypothetical protein